VKVLKNAPFIIFTTAFPEYAIESYNVNAVDYLLKPVAFERFLRSVDKAKYMFDRRTEPAKQENPATHLFVKEDYKLVKINHDEIFFIQGMKDYVKIYTPVKTIITRITMKRLEELLPAPLFFRTHKSFIVRLEAIKAINGNTIENTNNS
jgi:DNA-binding LytR/AlgR family response regulator